MTRAEPFRLLVLIFFMNDGTSIRVGQALMQGASKQYRQRFASIIACWDVKGGLMSAKFRSYSCGDNLEAILTNGISGIVEQQHSIVSSQLSEGHRMESIVNGQWSVVRGRLSKFNCQLFWHRLFQSI